MLIIHATAKVVVELDVLSLSSDTCSEEESREKEKFTDHINNRYKIIVDIYQGRLVVSECLVHLVVFRFGSLYTVFFAFGENEVENHRNDS